MGIDETPPAQGIEATSNKEIANQPFTATKPSSSSELKAYESDSLPRLRAGQNFISPPSESIYNSEELLKALNANLWNVSKTARQLGLGRATVYRKINHWGLRRPGWAED